MNIGYYAHHHGTGHCRQADKLTAHLIQLDTMATSTATNIVTVFTSLSKEAYAFQFIGAENVIRLPDEHQTKADVLPGRAGEYWQPECLHYSPVGNEYIQKRSQLILTQVQSRQIELMIIDVSVEVALLCRTASIPYLYVRLPGDRNDTPHRNAFQGALGLIAAYPEALESADTPEWVRQKTLYIGFLPRALPTPNDAEGEFIHYINDLIQRDGNDTRLSIIQGQDNEDSIGQDVSKHNKTFKNQVPHLSDLPPIVTVIKGFGGHEKIDDILPKIRQWLPQAFIISLGPITDSAVASVDFATQIDDVFPFLQYSDLLVMACGLNAIGEACQFNTPLLVVPDTRPHDEQQKMAEALMDCGRALGLQQFEAYWHQNNTDNTSRLDHSSIDDFNSMKKDMARLKPTQPLVEKLSNSNSIDLMVSLAKAENVKVWFYETLLPKLTIQPNVSS